MVEFSNRVQEETLNAKRLYEAALRRSEELALRIQTAKDNCENLVVPTAQDAIADSYFEFVGQVKNWDDITVSLTEFDLYGGVSERPFDPRRDWVEGPGSDHFKYSTCKKFWPI